MPTRILVVDDNPVNLRLTIAFLARADFQTAGAESAEQALELMPDFQPDIVLTDWQLPGMDGLALTRLLKSDPEWRWIPVVLLTAAAGEEERQQALDAGCDALISKPVKPAELQRVMASVAAGGAEAAPVSAEDREGETEELAQSFLREAREECANLMTAMRPRALAPLLDQTQLRGALHRWAGVGGSLGFPEITEKAREAEALLTRPYEEVAPVVRERLVELARIFRSPARREEGPGEEPVEDPIEEPIEEPVEEPAGARLPGLRFWLINFRSDQAGPLLAAIEKAEAFARIAPPREPLPKVESLRLADIVVCNLKGAGSDAPALINRLSESGRPRLILGDAKLALPPELLAPSSRHEFLPAPWEPEEVVARAEALMERYSHASDDRKPSVLVCDDDPTVRKLLKNAIESQQMICRMAENGRVALAAARNNPPDAIVLDLNIPGLDGFRILEALRKMDRTRKIPVMMLTGSQNIEDVVRGLRLGANDYVVKPFNALEVVARLRRFLQ